MVMRKVQVAQFVSIEAINDHCPDLPRLGWIELADFLIVDHQ
jgi:hypothetical protein